MNVIEVETNPEEACDCLCHFNIKASIEGLDEDTDYTVRLWTEGQIALIHEEVVQAD